jgi:16S rRNA (adenine1518-N6/adenine1519-N6)-dimethyltransferase
VIAKKKLGQNFLRDREVIRKIISSLKPTEEDVLLEIGCGRGALTQHLVGTTGHFIGIELDSKLWSELNARLGSPSVLFLNQDILTVHLQTLLPTLSIPRTPIKVVGNIPYYISSFLVQWLTKQVESLDSATIMFQREVAERLSAEPGTKEYGLLTLLGQYYFQVSPLFFVGRKAFWPEPKVDSQVLRFDPLSKRILAEEKEAAFFSFLKSCFSQRRKILVNCLKNSPFSAAALEVAMKHLGLTRETRAEELSIKELCSLFLELEHAHSIH